MEAGILVRKARPDDGAKLAQIWLEFGMEYAAVDTFAFQIPEAEGLREWLERGLAEAVSDRKLTLVAEVDGAATSAAP